MAVREEMQLGKSPNQKKKGGREERAQATGWGQLIYLRTMFEGLRYIDGSSSCTQQLGTEGSMLLQPGSSSPPTHCSMKYNTLLVVHLARVSIAAAGVAAQGFRTPPKAPKAAALATMLLGICLQYVSGTFAG